MLAKESASLIEFKKKNEVSSKEQKFFLELKEKGFEVDEEKLSIILSLASKLLVESCAGSGKTSLIVAKALYLSQVLGVDSKKVLMIAFSKKAVTELKDRIIKISPNSNYSILTVHGISFRILSHFGYSHYKVIDEYTQKGILNSILRKKKLTDLFTAEDLLLSYNFYINSMSKCTDTILEEIFNEYEEVKLKCSYLDFSDMLKLTYCLLFNNLYIRKKIQNQFMHILFDEVQDSTPLLYSIVRLICSDSTGLYAFGDQNQAIFSFMGAEDNIFKRIKYDFSGIEIHQLNTNYRSTQEICDMATSSLGLKTKMKATREGSVPIIIRPSNTLDEAKYIVSNIVNQVQQGNKIYSDYCILYRTESISTSLVEELLNKGIPFISSSKVKTIYENNISSFLLNHLKLSIDPNSANSLIHICNSFYVSKDIVSKLINSPSNIPISYFDLMLDKLVLADYQIEIISNRSQLISSISSLPPADALKLLFKDKDVFRHLKRSSGYSKDIFDEIILDIKEKLIESASSFDSIKIFLDHVESIITKNRRRKSSNNAVTLSTIHSAKGLQWDSVYIISCIEDVIPHKKVIEPSLNDFSTGSIEEENRLFYVALSRAENELIISAPSTSNNKTAQISRFLKFLESDK